MNMFDRLAALAAQSLNKATESAPSGARRGDWKDSLRGMVDSVGAATHPAPSTISGQPAPLTPPLAPPSSATTASRPPVGLTPPPAKGTGTDDRAAVARYEYLVRTAEPAQLEHIHADAFARLTPQQREELRLQLTGEMPPAERPRSASSSDLARTATRAELLRPGTLTRVLRSTGGRRTLGTAGFAAGGLLAAVAAGAVASTFAVPLLADAMSAGVDFDAFLGAVDVEGLAGGVGDLAGGVTEFASGASELTAGAADYATEAGEQLTGLAGEQLTGLGESIAGFDLPGIGDLFGR